MKSYYKTVECQTMGHLNCRKFWVLRDDRWRIDRIEHFVFGKKYVEKF